MISATARKEENMIILAYSCYIIAALDIWTAVSCWLRGERLVAALSAARGWWLL